MASPGDDPSGELGRWWAASQSFPLAGVKICYLSAEVRTCVTPRAVDAAPMITDAIPLLHVHSYQQAVDFYRDGLGFTVQSLYQPSGSPDPAYVVMIRKQALIHVSSFPGDEVAGGVVTFAVTDVKEIDTQLVNRGVDVGAGIMDQSWGNREVYVRDPAGNSIRFQSC